MIVTGKIVVVTGGASGIGAALCREFANHGAQGIMVADIDQAGAEQVADEIGGSAMAVDVAREDDIQHLVRETTRRLGPIDLFCSNAGVGCEGGLDATNADWQRLWDINLMSHVYAARALLPMMLERKQGYLLQTASAAGLLTQLGSAPYAVTKHAAVAFAEWLSITYWDAGIRVSCLCPQGVRTKLLAETPPSINAMLTPTAIDPEVAARCTIEGLAEERFLILPHPEVAEYYRNRAGDNERWLRGMRRWQAKLFETNP
ncbi:MAG: SDR family NAD(P)-dependent oxidoreductase [Pirellulaceae bacterium]|nr:SDR family NAD(P)-dependent oxidoreductase [Pirellulaceae bacterium]